MLDTFRKYFSNKQRVVKLAPGNSFHDPKLDLVISCEGVFYVPNPKGRPYKDIRPEYVDLVIGAPGMPNSKKELQLGDAVLYQTPNYGVVEIRAFQIKPDIKLMISVVTPRSGFSAAYESDSLANAPFSSDETAKISHCIENVGEQMSTRKDISPEQLAFMNSKLQEVVDASKRLGRKDWVMFVAGTLTNVVVGSAFAPDAAKSLFSALNKELSWVFQNALRLILN